MTPQELKNSILQLAIQGKLVEQRAEEGTAAELVEKILAAKNAKGAKKNLTRSRGARGENKTSASPREKIPDDEKPFDIPDSWEWVRLESIINSIPSKQYQILESEVKPSGVFSVISQSKEYSIGFTDKSEKVYHHVNPVIVFGDHTAEVKFVEFDFVVGADGVKIFEPLDGIVIAKFLFYVLQFHSSDLSKVGGYSRHYKFLKDKPIPLPPLAEQKRIVAKIEELLPLIDRYEKAWSKLEDFNKRFPVDMQKSLLQMAIQGKLVDHRPEEGTGEELYRKIIAHKKTLFANKKEGKLSKEHIAEDEIPFDIPETWKWVRFGHIMINRDAERIPLSVDERSKLAKKYDYYGASGVIDKVDDFIFDKPLLLIGEDGANLLTRNTPIAFIARGKYWVNNHAHVLDCNSDLVHIEYVMWFINAINLAPYVTGTAQPKMNQQKMNSIPVALPPFAEQKRIVAKLEEILPLCERLK